MSTNAERHEFSASEVAELLAELDRRLRRRGVSASVFVVGGAAVAVAGIRGKRLTEDVDVVTDELVVLEEAALLGRERGLPENWLNPNADVDAAAPWRSLGPPRRPGVAGHLRGRRVPIRYQTDRPAGEGHRRRRPLAKRLGMQDASADELESHMRRYYIDEAALKFIVDGDDVDSELRNLAEDAAAMLKRRAASG